MSRARFAEADEARDAGFEMLRNGILGGAAALVLPLVFLTSLGLAGRGRTVRIPSQPLVLVLTGPTAFARRSGPSPPIAGTTKPRRPISC